jgi:molybdopterin converting factor small subunit
MTHVTVRVPTPLRKYAGGQSKVAVETDDGDPTVETVLGALARTCPGVVDRVLDEQGALRRHVNVFVDEEEVRFLGGLAAPVADGAVVSILPAVSGGAHPRGAYLNRG